MSISVSCVPSPCVNVCRMDADSALCVGCFRTLDEIAKWSGAADSEKQAILATVEKRREEHGRIVPSDPDFSGDCKRQLAMTEEEQYLCVGVCMADPDSGYCVGCGRPPLPSPANTIVVEERLSTHAEILPNAGDPDTPT